jgi:Ku70/Ku80 N-terminal alpha/beta domain.
MPDIRKLRETIKPSKTNRGDGMWQLKSCQASRSDFIQAISSIVIAMQMIIEYTKKNKYKRKIVLVTNGTGPMSDDNIEGIIERWKKLTLSSWSCMFLAVVYFTFMLIISSGADFDDAEYGVKEEDKDSRKVLSRV